MTTHFKLRVEAAGPHIEVTVFAGPKGETLQNLGRLIMDVGEWQLFGCALSMGAERMMAHMSVETEGEREALRLADAAEQREPPDICNQCDVGYHDRCAEKNCACACQHGPRGEPDYNARTPAEEREAMAKIQRELKR